MSLTGARTWLFAWILLLAPLAAGGADDVMKMVDALERAELHWCAR